MCHQGFNCFFRRPDSRAHQYHYALGVGGSHVVKKAILAPGALGEAVHDVFYDGGAGAIERVDSFPGLKEDIRVLGGPTQNRAIRRQGSGPVVLYELRVHHGPQVIVRERADLGHLMGGAEAIEEMKEGDTRFKRSRLGDQRKVHGLLDGIRGQEGKPRGTGGHDVTVITEDGERVRRHRARRHMDHAGGEFAGDLVHVGNHQQQALRGGKGSGQRAGLKSAMQCAGGPTFALHFDHLRNCSPNVLAIFACPLIGPFAHGRGRGNGVDGNYFIQAEGDGSNSFISVKDSHVPCHV